MKTLFFFSLFGLPPMSLASDAWLCTSESSQVHGGSVFSCGIGVGKDEGEARAKAFGAAQSEFYHICGASTNCKGHAVIVEPRRTTCETANSGYKCYRLVVFTVSDETVKHQEKIAAFKAKGKADQMEAYWNNWMDTNLRNKVANK